MVDNQKGWLLGSGQCPLDINSVLGPKRGKNQQDFCGENKRRSLGQFVGVEINWAGGLTT